MSILQTAASQTARFVGRESWLVRQTRPAYEYLLDWSHGGRGIPWSINGQIFRIDPRCRPLMGHNYEPAVAAFIRERIKPGALCFDVGANVGVYVLQLAHWSAPTGRVVAFEPNPTARIILEKHIQLNEVIERVRIVPAAIGRDNGEAILFADGADVLGRLIESNPLRAGSASQVTVPVMTLDDFCSREKLIPDWLLMDIEGFEIEALAGAREVIKSCGRSLEIVVEMHPAAWESSNTTREKAEALFAEFGRRPIPLTGQSDPLNEYGLVHLAVNM